MLTLILNIIGLIIGILLFVKRPLLENDLNNFNDHENKISVVIPARNEEKNLGLLLSDLKNQNYQAFEIICVDDCSEDLTKDVALNFGAKLISINQKPEGWQGKSWACNVGADNALGDLILFLDADVRLKPNALGKLVKTFNKYNCSISVQPYHVTNKYYEQLSFFFNAILIAGNGAGFLIKVKNIGLFGPVILINKQEYQNVNGHYAARESIVDDLTLGRELNENGFDYKLFYGDSDISFCMYNSGFIDLYQGWTKNFATGAAMTPKLLLIFIIIWVTACASIFISLALSIIGNSSLQIATYLFLYLLVLLELKLLGNRIGNFKGEAIVFYPVLLLAFILILSISIIKKCFKLKVAWKGRNIKLRS
jgi:4,4'-diaponeurosporenoate glycosyltransferase